MSDDAQQRRGSKELFWAIPKGTVCFEPAPVVKLKLAELKAKPLAPATRDEMIERSQK